MSQRQGPPQSTVSRLCLRLVAWFTCRDTPSEWQIVWRQHDELHHSHAPRAQGAYCGHTCRWDLETHPLQPTVVYSLK